MSYEIELNKWWRGTMREQGRRVSVCVRKVNDKETIMYQVIVGRFIARSFSAERAFAHSLFPQLEDDRTVHYLNIAQAAQMDMLWGGARPTP